MQVYRELRILTARPTLVEESKFPIAFMAAWAPRDMVGRHMARVNRERKSGTPGKKERCRSSLAAPASTSKRSSRVWRIFPLFPPPSAQNGAMAEGDLHGELARRDPEGAAQLEPGDRQRLVRALEVIEASGKPLRFWHAEAGEAAILKGVASERLFVNPDRALLHERAGRRFERMIDDGAIEEVRALLALKLPSSQPVMKAIGVRELGEYIHGKSTINEAVTQAQTATRQYIKRQLTWWRHQMSGWTVAGT